MISVLEQEGTFSGATKSGFSYAINRKALDNMELIDALADSADGDTLAVSKVCRLLLKPEQRKALYDHVRTEDGRVPTEAISAEIVEMFSALGAAGKNA